MRFVVSGLVVLLSCQGENIIEKQTNKLPTILIVSHSSGFEVQDGYTQSFFATVADDDNNFDELEVAWYLDDDIVCPLLPVTEDGESYCDISFVEGNTKVVAEVRDAYGAGGRAEVLVDVLESEPPEVEILSPLSTDALYSNQLISFTAFVSDAEDDEEDLDIRWTSSIDGPIFLDTSFDTSGEISDFAMLSFGQHAIELRVEDTTGKVTTDEVAVTVAGDNYIPECEIITPFDGSIFAVGDTVEFRAEATDDNIPNDLLMVEWVSDKDGFLTNSLPTTDGQVTFATADLSYNSHTITLRVEDEVGATCTDQILLSFTNAPQVSIISPVNGDVVDVGDVVFFEGMVSDVEDTETSLLVEWSSSLDGELYMGSPFANGLSSLASSELSVGAHVLSFSAEDTDGLRGEDVIVFTVNTPPVLSNVSLTPSSPEATDVVTCSATAYDPDGGNVSLTFDFLNQSTGVAYSATALTSSYATLNLGNTNILETETLLCTITATDSLGSVETAMLTVTVGSETPSFTSATSIVPATGVVTGTNLICSATAVQTGFGSVTPTYEWTIGGSSVGTGTVFTVSDSNSNVGDAITCTASATGNTGLTSTSSASVTVQNTAPVVQSMTLTPSPAYIDSTITCSVNSTDVDNDSLTYFFTFQNTSTGSSYGTGVSNGSSSTLDLTTVSASANEYIQCLAFVSDGNGGTTTGTASTLLSSDPTPYFSSTASILPSSGVVTGTTLTCSATASEAGATNPAVSYAWRRNGSQVGTGNSFTSTSSNTDVNDTIECIATAVGSTGLSITSSDSVTIQNTAPTVNSVTLSPSSVFTSSTLTCSASGVDVDADAMSYSYTFINQSTGTTYSFGTNNTVNLSSYSVSGGDVIGCTVTLTDTWGASDTMTATTTIGSNPIPTFTSNATITPGVGVTLAMPLTCSATATQQGGTPTLSYVWTVNGSVVGTGTNFTPSSSNSGVNTTVVCEATATGTTGLTATSSDSVGIQNRTPSVTTPSLTPSGSQSTGTTYTCSASGSDPDDGALTPSYTWYVGGSSTFQTGPTFTSSASNSSIGSSIQCEATVSDSHGGSDSALSNTSTVVNTLPNITGGGIQCFTFGGGCAPVCSDETVYCTSSVSDPDNNHTVTTQWTKNGTSTVVGYGSSLNLSTTSVGPGDTLYCTIIATDPYGSDTWTDPTTIDVTCD